MPVLPDLQALRTAADAVDRTAATVEATALAIDRQVEAIPWRGPRREVVAAEARVAVGTARAQAGAERDLARALRQLALDVEHELRVLADLAARARRHLEELLQRAQALVAATADAVAEVVARSVVGFVIEIATLDVPGALHEARRLAEEAVERMRSITLRLQSLPEPHDPAWRQVGPEILRWWPL